MYHAPTDCATVRKWLTKCADDSETANYISAHTKDVRWSFTFTHSYSHAHTLLCQHTCTLHTVVLYTDAQVEH